MTSGPSSRPLDRPLAWTAVHGAQIFFGAVIVWVAAVFLMITFEPETGARSTEALQAAVRSSITSQDADRFGHLFAAGTVGDDYPATLLTRLRDSDPGGWRTEIRELGAGRDLVLSAASGCLSWALTRKDERWYLDGVPTPQSACPR